MPYDRLTSIDASFLRLERLETPMHVGALSVFEGAPFFGDDGRFRLRAVRDLVASRLHLIPRFRKRIQDVPLDAGEPIWVDDERFDIGYHVRLTALPAPGARDQLIALFERVQAQVLDRSRPLWELWFVEGLEGGHVALFQKTHHALVDGVSGVDVATVLLDFEPEPRILDAPPWRPEPAPPSARLLVDTMKELVAGPQALIDATRRAVEVPRRAVDRVTELVRSLATLREGGIVAPRTSLNHPVEGRSRSFGLVPVPLDDVKTVRRAFGGTVNDIVLAGIGGGIARLLDSRGELHPDLVLKVFCPVSVRDDSQHLQLGNKISAMFVPLPVGELDPVARLAAVQRTTTGLKEREQAVGAAALLGLTQYAAPTLMGLGARLVHHQPLVNLVCTNVPGPQVPLYCLGARMLEAYPMVPLARNLNLGVAILSYCGTLQIGLLADRDQWPDLEVLEAGIDESFAELTKLARELEPEAAEPEVREPGVRESDPGGGE
jgi:WS/DGAT/MGAT family acyltransferase